MSKSLQHILVAGFLSRDPEVRSTSSGQKVANFSIPVESGYGTGQYTEWFTVVAFGALAEFTEKYLKKGKSVAVTGKLRTRTYTDKHGVEKKATDLTAKTIDFFEESNRSDSSSSRTTAPATRTATPVQTRAAQPANDDPFGEEDPF